MTKVELIEHQGHDFYDRLKEALIDIIINHPIIGKSSIKIITAKNCIVIFPDNDQAS